MQGKKPNKITVLMDDDEFALFDDYCNERGFKKSTLIVRLVREHLVREGFATGARPPKSTMRVAEAK